MSFVFKLYVAMLCMCVFGCRHIPRCGIHLILWYLWDWWIKHCSLLFYPPNVGVVSFRLFFFLIWIYSLWIYSFKIYDVMEEQMNSFYKPGMFSSEYVEHFYWVCILHWLFRKLVLDICITGSWHILCPKYSFVAFKLKPKCEHISPCMVISQIIYNSGNFYTGKT